MWKSYSIVGSLYYSYVYFEKHFIWLPLTSLVNNLCTGFTKVHKYRLVAVVTKEIINIHRVSINRSLVLTYRLVYSYGGTTVTVSLVAHAWHLPHLSFVTLITSWLVGWLACTSSSIVHSRLTWSSLLVWHQLSSVSPAYSRPYCHRPKDCG